ncbi:MAG: hypothetical protein WCO98_03235 [bacterium]
MRYSLEYADVKAMIIDIGSLRPNPVSDYDEDCEAIREWMANVPFEWVSIAFQVLCKENFDDYINEIGYWNGNLTDAFSIIAERDPSKFYEIVIPYLDIDQTRIIVFHVMNNILPPQGVHVIDYFVDNIAMLTEYEILYLIDLIALYWDLNTDQDSAKSLLIKIKLENKSPIASSYIDKIYTRIIA